MAQKPSFICVLYLVLLSHVDAFAPCLPTGQTATRTRGEAVKTLTASSSSGRSSSSSSSSRSSSGSRRRAWSALAANSDTSTAGPPAVAPGSRDNGMSRRAAIGKFTSSAAYAFSAGVGTFSLFSAGFPRGSEAASSLSVVDILTNIERVRTATEQLEDDLTNGTGAGGGASSDPKALVKSLLRNYRLEDCIRQGRRYLSGPKKADAVTAGTDALEYLVQIMEYFPETLDNTTGLKKKELKPEAIEFTVKALSASREKLSEFLKAAPSEELRSVRAALEQEAKDFSS